MVKGVVQSYKGWFGIAQFLSYINMLKTEIGEDIAIFLQHIQPTQTPRVNRIWYQNVWWKIIGKLQLQTEVHH